MLHKNSENSKNYLCQGPLELSARQRIFHFRLPGVLPQYYQHFFKHNTIVTVPFTDLTQYSICVSVSMLSLIALALPISSLRVSLKLLWCCLHKKLHQLGTAQHIDQYCLNLVVPWCFCF